MILQALTRYYDILADDPESDVAPPGYSVAKVSFVLNLSPQGKLLDIFPLYETTQRGGKTVEIPRRMIVPEQIKLTSGISANFLCGTAAYVLGLSEKEAKDPEFGNRRFKAFRELNVGLLAEAQCADAKAVVAFLENYDPKEGKENPIIVSHLENILKGGNLVFKLDGTRGYVHEALEIRRIWEKHKLGARNEIIGQCLVTGEIGPIARLHPSLKGIYGGQPSGVSLVSFNDRAYESYNRTEGQGLNAPVSEKAAFAYTTALNYLLSTERENKKFTIGDTTVVYWAESKEKAYDDVIAGLFDPDAYQIEGGQRTAGDQGRKKAENLLKQIAEKVKMGKPAALDDLEGLDGETRFYVLGLAPNAGRVSVRFFHQDPFAKIVQKFIMHYADLQIGKEYPNQPDLISIRQIIGQTISKKSADPKASPLLAGSVFRAILENTPYPAALYYAVINRIHADADDPKRKDITKINYVRAAIIKAYLMRKYRQQVQNPYKEVLVMSLNNACTIPAYVLGRLFAVLEKVQKEAVNPDATIKDRYFASACASPSSVFPVLLRLSQHHIAKAEYGHASDNLIEELLNLLDVEKNPIPAHLSLDEQGIFVLGYYHQRAAFYVPRERVNAAQPTVSDHSFQGD